MGDDSSILDGGPAPAPNFHAMLGSSSGVAGVSAAGPSDLRLGRLGGLGLLALLAWAPAGCSDEPCALPSGCTSGQICEPNSGECVSVLPDAGVLDGGASADSGGPGDDAGDAPDAAADAGVGDDAEVVDLGSPDSGTVDVGFPDAGLVPPDAGFAPVRLQFPPGGGVLTSADALTVRGVIDVPETISEVSVNGVSATSDDGFAHFTAEIPLTPGPNPVEVRYVAGGVEQTETAGQVAQQDVLLLTPIAITTHAGRLYVVDSAFDRLVSLRTDGTDAQVVSGTGVGSGTSFVDPQGLVVTSSGAEAFVLDRSRDAVLRVDLATGARSILSRHGGSTGAGPRFDDPRGLDLDEAGGRIWVSDSRADALFSVDLLTGDRTIVSNDDTGGGTTFTTPRAVRYDAARGRVWVSDTSRDTIFGVDPVTGDRAALTGAGPSLPEPTSLAFTLDGTGLWVTDMGSDALLRVDLSNGARTLIANAGNGTGPWFEPRSVAEDISGVYVLDNARDGLVRVDPVTGDRTSVFANVTAEGLHLGTPWGVAVHPVDPTAPMLFSDNYFDRIVAFDPRTGVRRTLLSGAAIAAPYGMAYDADDRRALFVDTSLNALMSVDVNDGTPIYVSDEVVAGGPIFASPRDVVRTSDGRLFVVDDAIDSVLEVEASGRRVVLGSDGTGSGTELDQPYAVAVRTSTAGTLQVLVADSGSDVVMVVDPATGARWPLPGADANLSTPRGMVASLDGATLYVSDQTRRMVISVDLVTGARATVTSNTVGRGPRLGSPTGLAVHPDDYLVLVDNNDAVFAVDLATGERVYLTK